ncbi:class I SAM-dependent methyltransferase [bacterium]|nr:class I SAM-dependent methyltransferase [bacterium]
MIHAQAVISLSNDHLDRDSNIAKALQIEHVDWNEDSSLKPKEIESKLRERFISNNKGLTYLLIRRDGLLSLTQVGSDSLLSVSADFCCTTLNYRRLKGGGKNQMLAKAIGLNKRANLKVLDCTAGLGRDAFILASLGCTIQLIERVSEVSILLKDALELATHSIGGMDSDFRSTIDRLRLIERDSLEYMSELNQETLPDVIYLDPMFPERKKSALVKKEMRVFHDLVGPDNDADELLKAAIKTGVRRVVVKRPRIAPALKLESRPSHSLDGKSNRYDIYLT